MRIGSARVRVRSGRTWFLSFSTPGSRIWGPCCVEDERRCSDGGRADDRFTHGALPFSTVNAVCDDDRPLAGRIWIATTTAERPATTAAVSDAATKPVA